MSVPNLKPLSKGKCLQDLKAHYDKELPKTSVSQLCKSAPKLFDAARKADNSGNQEESYIFYMRYLNIASYVQQSEEYKRKKPDLELKLSKVSMKSALESAEKLSKILQERYQEQEKKIKEKAELSIIPLKVETGAQEEKSSVKDNSPTPPIPERDSITCMELFQILEKKPSNVLIMDVRPRNQFSESHINFDCCISIPEEIVERGCSAAKLAQKLPEESKIKWHKRLEVDYLVLLDWLSSSSKMQADSHLQHLRTIMLEWDPSNKYRSKPLTLDGGFENWLHHYPMHCTNAKPQLPNCDFNDLLDIDDVIYPDLVDEQPKFSRATKPTSNKNFTTSNGTSEEKVVPKVEIKYISDEAITPILLNSHTPSILDATTSISKGQDTPFIIPNIDRSSKSAAVQKYQEMEDKREKGMQLSISLSRDREAAESELKKLKQQHGRNQMTGKEKDTLYQNERNLQLRIEELQDSQRRKDKENEILREALEEYKRREREVDHELAKSAGIPVTASADIKSLINVEKQNTVKPRLGPSTPTGEGRTELSIPSSASGLKRSRSSPNIAQLVQEPEQKPPQPQFDRNTKPTIQKPQHFEFINRPRNFQEVYGIVKQGLTGLRNLGNSCYMNSILQCISNINVLVNYFCSGKYKEDLNRSPHNPTRGEVAEEVAQVIRHLWFGQYRSIACRDLKNVVGKHMDQFRGCGQQDAHEFLTFLMDWLHNDLKLQKEEIGKEVSNSLFKKNSEIDAITGAINTWNNFKSKHESFMLTGFFIQQVSTVQCCSCRAKSMNFEEPTSNLTLLLPSASRCMLSDCLRLYTSKEKISGYKCESCHGLHDAEKSVDLCRLPPILIIHLKRFYSDGFYQKRQTFVDFPLENLDMKNYTPDRHQSHTVYNLCGVSNHYGTLEGGHYTAYCKNGTRWYKFDDQDVDEISREDVKSANAYILFYAAVR